jgi:hypothetical protein
MLNHNLFAKVLKEAETFREILDENGNDEMKILRLPNIKEKFQTI